MRTVKPDLDAAAKRFGALSDPTRLRILELLVDGERCVCELTDALDAAQSRLSFHLRTLKEAGLVRDRRDGRWVYYTLETDVLGEMASLLSGAEAGELSWRVPSRRRGNGCCD